MDPKGVPKLIRKGSPNGSKIEISHLECFFYFFFRRSIFGAKRGRPEGGSICDPAMPAHVSRRSAVGVLDFGVDLGSNFHNLP